jgi:long-subunit acyl-CoA synthetase (AMP-forming)
MIHQIREALGLDATRGFYTGSAPISPEVVEYFSSLNIPIYEGFGMSECVGTYSLACDKTWKIGHVGRPLRGPLILRSSYHFHRNSDPH